MERDVQRVSLPDPNQGPGNLSVESPRREVDGVGLTASGVGTDEADGVYSQGHADLTPCSNCGQQQRYDSPQW